MQSFTSEIIVCTALRDLSVNGRHSYLLDCSLRPKEYVKIENKLVNNVSHIHPVLYAKASLRELYAYYTSDFSNLKVKLHKHNGFS